MSRLILAIQTSNVNTLILKSATLQRGKRENMNLLLNMYNSLAFYSRFYYNIHMGVLP